MARVIIVYNKWRKPFKLTDMAYIRWFKIGEALSRLGHQVDLPTNELRWLKWWTRRNPVPMNPNLRRIPLSSVKWNEYDVVKTMFSVGFETLEAYGGADHPFIISKLGSVVGARDMEGIYFYGKVRERYYACQERIQETSRYITVLTEKAKELWVACHGTKDNFLLIPGAVDAQIPKPGADPFPQDGQLRCIFAGNVYNQRAQPEANATLIRKLNHLGSLLSKFKIRIYLLGPGDVSKLDPRYVSYLGVIPYEKSWDYLYFANVGLVISAGKFMHNNESTKIYHYIRAGLPCVNESGFPNDFVVKDSRLGFVVESENMELLAEKVAEAAHHPWDREYGINYILNHHTWDRRAAVYDAIIKRHLG
jgi:hypothetical protein